MRYVLLMAMFLFSQNTTAQFTEENVDFSNMADEALLNFDDLSANREDELRDLARHPVNVNYANETALSALPNISAWQIDQLLKYRRTMGLLISVYELQAVPGWDVDLCKHLLPYVTVSLPSEYFSFKMHEQQLFIRMATKDIFGSTDSALHYHGSGLSANVKYTVNGKNWQGGFSGEKDAGEDFFGSDNRRGFDHYGYYLSIKKAGPFSLVTIGDYTINLGQGLICWMNLGFGKSTEIVQIKRQAPVIKPYRAGGEGKFFRGVAMSLHRGGWEYDLFASYRKLDAHIYRDSIDQSTYFTSVQMSGLHRTDAEIRDRGMLGSVAGGGRLKKQWSGGYIAMQGVYYRYQYARHVPDVPYRLYEKPGFEKLAGSIDHSFTYKNCHFFGETALIGSYPAFLEGILIALAPRFDVSILARHIHPGYSGIYGQIIGEHTDPGNERGVYLGFSFKFNHMITFRGFTDKYYIPWVQYRVTVPATGNDYASEIQCTLSKKSSITFHTRVREAVKEMVKTDNLGLPLTQRQFSCRLQTEFMVNQVLKCKIRADWNNLQYVGYEELVFGRSFSGEFIYQKSDKPWRVNGRIQSYDTDSYDSRIYGFERGLNGSSSLSSVYGQGSRLYVNFQYDVSSALCGWIKVGKSSFPLITNQDPYVITNSKSMKIDFQVAILQKF